MKPRAGLAHGIVACLLLHGCIPAQFSGYMPVGPGRLERDHCTTIEDILTFSVDGGVELTAWVPKSSMPADLRVWLTVPAGSVVRLRSPVFALESAAWREPQLLRTVAIASRKSGDAPPSAEMRGERQVNYTAWGSIDSVAEGSQFWIKFARAASSHAGTAKAGSFTLRFPELDINGEIRQVKPLLFEAYTKVGLAGFCN